MQHPPFGISCFTNATLSFRLFSLTPGLAACFHQHNIIFTVFLTRNLERSTPPHLDSLLHLMSSSTYTMENAWFPTRFSLKRCELRLELPLPFESCIWAMPTRILGCLVQELSHYFNNEDLNKFYASDPETRWVTCMRNPPKNPQRKIPQISKNVPRASLFVPRSLDVVCKLCPQKDKESLLDKAIARLDLVVLKEGGHGRIGEYYGHFKQIFGYFPMTRHLQLLLSIPPKGSCFVHRWHLI